MPNNIENNNQVLYETRSEEVQELIGKMPNWLLRFGILIIGIILGLIFLAAAYIKYPDKVLVAIVIEQSNTPISIYAKTSGVLKEVYVAENDTVQMNQPIGILATIEDKKELDILDNLIKEKLNRDAFIQR
jgi:multidrug efflux pump subunit AcrA (membrane-fusion protein)